MFARILTKWLRILNKSERVLQICNQAYKNLGTVLKSKFFEWNMNINIFNEFRILSFLKSKFNFWMTIVDEAPFPISHLKTGPLILDEPVIVFCYLLIMSSWLLRVMEELLWTYVLDVLISSLRCGYISPGWTLWRCVTWFTWRWTWTAFFLSSAL